MYTPLCNIETDSNLAGLHSWMFTEPSKLYEGTYGHLVTSYNYQISLGIDTGAHNALS